MYKKIRNFLSIIPLLFIFLLIIASCGGTDSPKGECEHQYSYFPRETGHVGICDKCQEQGDVIPHTFGEWEVINDSTYQSAGQKSRRCPACGYQEYDSIPVKTCDHNGGSWFVSSTPTVDNPGELAKDCPNCFERISVNLPTLNQTDYTYTVDEDGSCVTHIIEKYVFEKDGQKFPFEVSMPPTGHKYDEPVWEYDLNINSATATFTCSTCEDVYKVGNIMITVSGDASMDCSERTVETDEINVEGKVYSDKRTLEHTYENNWRYDYETHYLFCSICNGGIKDEGEHHFEDNKCLECEMEYYSQGLIFEQFYNTYIVSLEEGLNPETVIIPSFYQGAGVSEIASSAFKDCTNLKSIVLPETVSDIGASAFAGCTGLTDVVFHSNYVRIGSSAFAGCTSLMNITFKNGYLESNVFTGCTSLKEFTFPEETNIVPDNTFTGCSALESVTLPDGLTEICREAFSNCSSLENIIIPASVKYIEYGSFSNSGLRSITLPSSVEDIGDSAFANCTYLTEVVIGSKQMISENNKLTDIGYRAFQNCSALEDIYLPATIETIEWEAFKDCTSLEHIYYKSDNVLDWIGITLDSLDANPMYYANHFMIWQPSIEDFADVEELNLVFDGERGEIPSFAFAGLKNVEKINVDNATVSNYAFYNVKGNITIGDLDYIGEYAFAGTDIVSVNLDMPDLGRLYSNAFADCLNLESVTITKTLTLENKVFDNCPKLKTVVTSDKNMSWIPDDVENLTFVSDEVVAYKFRVYENLKTLSFDKNIKTFYSISASSFPALEEVRFLGTLEDWCKIIFYSNANPMCLFDNFLMYNEEGELAGIPSKLVIPEGVTNISGYAFYGDKITSVVLPESLSTIGSKAFCNCTKLYEVFNLSDLPITKGSEAYGSVGYYAVAIHSSLVENTQFRVDDFIFVKDDENYYYLIDYIGNKSDIVLPEAVRNNDYALARGVFANRKSLTSVVVPSRVTSIEFEAFKGCDNLQSITLPFVGPNNGTSNTHFGYIFGAGSSDYNYKYVPKNLRTVILTGGDSIESKAFNSCGSIKNITIPDNITNIASDAFHNCTFVKVTMPTSAIPVIPKYYLQEVILTSGDSIEEKAFEYCWNLISITLPESLTSIGKSAFFRSNKLYEIYNYSNLNITKETSSEYGGIAYCAKVIHTQPEASMYIEKDDYIFYKDDANKYYLIAYRGDEDELVLPNHINAKSYEINDYAFYNLIDYGYTTITSITIPEGVTAIGENAFAWNNNLKDVIIPSTVKSIGAAAFSGCRFIESITLPNGIDSIATYAFSGCWRLRSIIIPSSVGYIGIDAFRDCETLRSIVIPSSVATIDKNAFLDCDMLETVYFTGTAESWTIITQGIDGSEKLTAAIVYYYSEENPTEAGNFWHYVDGVPTAWGTSLEI